MLKVLPDNPLRKNRKKQELPKAAYTNTENIRSTYNNGILEIIFNKKIRKINPNVK